jgi:ribosomal protein S9
MENTQTTSKSPKLKLDFKDSKYATGRRKTSIAKVWLKKVLEKYMSMVNFLMNIFQVNFIIFK